MLKGALAAAVTPLRDGGEALDEEAFAPYLGYLADGGLDGILALGTTGEGILLSEDERKRAAELFVSAAGDGFDVAVHCGAQTTAQTVALAVHAARSARMPSRSSARPTTRSTSGRCCCISQPRPKRARRCRSTSTSSAPERATRFRRP